MLEGVEDCRLEIKRTRLLYHSFSLFSSPGNLIKVPPDLFYYWTLKLSLLQGWAGCCDPNKSTCHCYSGIFTPGKLGWNTPMGKSTKATPAGHIDGVPSDNHKDHHNPLFPGLGNRHRSPDFTPHCLQLLLIRWKHSNSGWVEFASATHGPPNRVKSSQDELGVGKGRMKINMEYSLSQD